MLGYHRKAARAKVRTRLMGRCPGFELLETRRVLDSTVVFSELMYHPPETYTGGEWIELHNQMAVAMDVSAWSLQGGVEYEFAEGTVIPGGGYLLIAADPATFSAATGIANVKGPFLGSLANDGETVELRDRTDRLMNTIDYNDRNLWPAAPDGSGATLAKRQDSQASEDVTNWTFSPQVGGTPGEKNFPDPNSPPTTQALVTLESPWRYHDGGIDLGTAWRANNFNDSGWSSGTPLFYAGDGQLDVVEPERITGVAVTPSSQFTGREAINTVNGSGLSGGIHSTDVGAMWLTNGNIAAPNDAAPAITFDLGSVQTIDQMRLWNYNEYRPDLPARVNELLGRGIKNADILVAGADQVFTPLIVNHQFAVVTPATSNTDFSEVLDFGGVSARYVRIDIHSNYNGKDFNNAASNDNLGNLAGLSEVQFFRPGDARETELAVGPRTHYFRQTFAFAGDPNLTDLILNTAVDDGAVYYLNGIEIHRRNMPTGAIGFNTPAASTVGNPGFTGGFEVPIGGLIAGQNTLAVEVHQPVVVDSDLLFAAQLDALVFPTNPQDLIIDVAINEVAAAGDANFFVELFNHGDSTVNLTGFHLQTSFGHDYVFPVQNLAAGQYVTVTAAQLGFNPAANDTLFLVNATDTIVLDGIDLRSQARARDVSGTGAWLRPHTPTPNANNTFSLATDVVINEIMYNHRPSFPTPEIPATFNVTPVMPFDAVWKYNRTGTDLGANWYTTDHVVDGTTWRSGPGLIGVEASALPEPLRTTWTPLTLSTRTYYFQTSFEYTGAIAGAEFVLEHIIDDGAVFYLNGQELLDVNDGSTRFNMAAGAVTSQTLATVGVDNANYATPIVLSPDDFLIGTNVLAVEVHQSAAFSNDLVFGLRLQFRQQLTPVVPSEPFRESDEEWVEFYNRGNSTVDLSGWNLDNAVDYTFPAGTVLPAGGYLVVARDADALAAKYQGLNVVGEFSGTLDNTTDTIVLRDQFGNPADSVQYFDDGSWPTEADAGGASLELRDPWADNSVASSWHASDETSRTEWRTYTYSGVAAASPVGPDTQWRELVLGMLDQGELLLDNISVIAQPGPTGVQLIGNSTFQADALGAVPAGWRFLGNHQYGEIIADPDDPTNRVLHLTATGATEHMHNHVETTFTGNQSVTNGQRYEISFRARWISGSPQLHTRLYFNRLPQVTILDRPTTSGTPGSSNSTRVTNIGPAYTGLIHSPAVPEPNQPVTISVNAVDPQGIAALALWYSINGGAWSSVPMTSAGSGRYSGIVPGQVAGAIVQFYVEGSDAHATAAAVSLAPSAGRASRALYKVNDGLASSTGIHNMRLLLTPADATWLHTDINLMSNDRIGGTVIYDESEIFYDVGIRLSGSQRARPVQGRISFSVGFHNEQLFRGVHQSITLDRSDSTGFGQREILLHHAMGHFGMDTAEYNDLIHIMTPRLEHTGGAEVEMARYTDVFLDAQYEDGGSGTVFEYELIYYPTTANAQGFKLPSPDNVVGTAIRSLGDSKESYRWNYQIKSQRDRDDYTRLIEWAKVMGTTGAAFNSQVANVIDVDQWLRGAAFGAASGFGDHYAAGDQHNAQFYIRPSDNKVLYFPHDLDAFFDRNRGTLAGNEISKIVSASPANRRAYYGHMHDFITSTYNGTYMAQWASNYKTLLPAQPYETWLADIAARATIVLSQINSAIPQIPYAITTPSPVDAGSSPSVTLTGNGWVNVRELRLAGTTTALNANWTTVTSWNVTVPVDNTTDSITIEAYDFRGTLVGTATVAVLSSAINPLADGLRITEINYNPASPTAAELAAIPSIDNDDFEFIELKNIGTTPLNLLNVTFDRGITYSLPSFELAPNAYGIVVSNLTAFQLRYGNSLPVIGQWTSGQLANDGETVSVVDIEGMPIVSVSYGDSDPWSEWADGVGGTLELVTPIPAATHHSKPQSWRGSAQTGGTPGAASSPFVGAVINEVRSGSAVELHNTTSQPINLTGWYLSSSQQNLRQFAIPANTTIAAGGYLVFDQSDFGPNPGGTDPNQLFISDAGTNEIWLVAVDNSGRATAFADEVHFWGTAAGDSWSRSPNASGRLAPTTRVTLGCLNSAPYGANIAISEINFHPAMPTPSDLAIAATLVADDLEFVELHNNTFSTVSLADWRIRGGIDYDFPTTAQLGANQTLLILSFDPLDGDNANRLAAFRNHYGIGNTVALLGGYSGQLNDASELVRLERPVNGTIPARHTVEDLLLYDDVAPWSSTVLGTGNSLQRRAPVFFASDASSWRTAPSSPGTATFSGNTPGDLNGDNLVNARDLDRMLDALSDGSQMAYLDLNGSNNTDRGDLVFLVEQILQTFIGDANLDRRVDATDFNIWSQNKFSPCGTSWSQADFSGDGVVDGSDFNRWYENRFRVGAAASSDAGPIRRETPRAAGSLLNSTETTNSVPHFASDRRSTVGRSNATFHSALRRQGDSFADMDRRLVDNAFARRSTLITRVANRSSDAKASVPQIADLHDAALDQLLQSELSSD